MKEEQEEVDIAMKTLAPSEPRIEFRWCRAALAALLVAVAASLLLAVAPAAAANGTAMTCSTRSLASMPLPSNGRRVHVINLTAGGVPCSKALELAKRAATDLVHGQPIALPGLVGVSTFSTTRCGSCVSSTRILLAFVHGTVNIGVRGLGGGWSFGGGSFSIPNLPGIPFPPNPLPAPPAQGTGPTTTV